MKNTLYWGDNLDVLKGQDGQDKAYFPDECVDLIYLDPPFNSKKSYNLLYKDQHGVPAPSQIHAFDDTWSWPGASATFDETINDSDTPLRVRRALMALRELLGTSAVMAYLAMMTPRLLQLHRVLKASGSLYLHCDPSNSHYLKMILDAIFGAQNFRNEIVWHYNTGGKGKTTFLKKHDTIFWYSKGDVYCFNRDAVAVPRTVGTAHLRHGVDESGREYYEDYSPRKSGKLYRWYLDEGLTPMDVWTDIQAINPVANERLGYPTQKPLNLLRRIISASSNPGDVILDPFCGCGTAIDAAHELGRTWIGIDVTHLAVEVIKSRLVGRYDLHPKTGYELIGEPRDLEGACALADHNKDQFELWALRQIGALPWEGLQKKGADRGRDGVLVWRDTEEHTPRHAVVSVKGGQRISSGDVRDLIGTAQTSNVEMGIFITLKKPTAEMKLAAAEGGMYQPNYSRERIPRIQILSIEDLLAGTARVHLPQGSLVISQKLPKRVVGAPPVQREMSLLTKMPRSEVVTTVEPATQIAPARRAAKKKVAV